MNSEPAALDALLRSDFYAFAHKAALALNGGKFHENWHLEALAHELMRCLSGETKRLIVTMPPRSLKSSMVSVALPAFALGRDPTKRIIGVSYAADLAAKLARDFRRLLDEPWYRRIFPHLRLDKDAEMEVETQEGGFRYATSIGGVVTGRGADLLIIDDPIKPEEALSRPARDRVARYFAGTLLSRLDDKVSGGIIAVMQRLHDEDLAGVLLRQPGWRHLKLPAIAPADETIDLGYGRVHHRRAGEALHPAREPLEVLEALRNAMGSAVFEAQYQQSPIPEAGNLIKREWLRFFQTAPSREGARVMQAWDTAMKAGENHDFSVCTTWMSRDNQDYLIDLVRVQEEYPALIRRVVERHDRYRPDGILIEDHGSGTALGQDLRAHHGIAPIMIRPKGDKAMRLSIVSPRFEAGQVHFLQDAPWLAELLQELLRFPQTRHDDQVDSVTLYLNWRRERPQDDFEVFWS